MPFAELDGSAAAHALDDELLALDRAAAGFGHLQDHGLVRSEGRTGMAVRRRRRTRRQLRYASEAGRVEPVAVLASDLLAPAVGRLVDDRPARRVRDLDARRSRPELTALLRAGFRMDGFPCLVCWDRPIADFSFTSRSRRACCNARRPRSGYFCGVLSGSGGARSPACKRPRSTPFDLCLW